MERAHPVQRTSGSLSSKELEKRKNGTWATNPTKRGATSRESDESVIMWGPGLNRLAVMRRCGGSASIFIGKGYTSCGGEGGSSFSAWVRGLQLSGDRGNRGPSDANSGDERRQGSRNWPMAAWFAPKDAWFHVKRRPVCCYTCRPDFHRLEVRGRRSRKREAHCIVLSAPKDIFQCWKQSPRLICVVSKFKGLCQGLRPSHPSEFPLCTWATERQYSQPFRSEATLFPSHWLCDSPARTGAAAGKSRGCSTRYHNKREAYHGFSRRTMRARRLRGMGEFQVPRGHGLAPEPGCGSLHGGAFRY